MISFDDLKQYDGNPPDKALKRKTYLNVMYGKHVKKLKESGLTISDYILGKILNDYKTDKIIVTQNRFPYDVQTNVMHLLVWLNPLYDGDEKYVRDVLKDSGLDKGTYVLFENDPDHRSVPGVRHFHLFIKTADAKKLTIEPEF